MDWLSLHKNIISFLLLLYAEPSLSRTIVDRVVSFIDNFIHNSFLPSLEKDILLVINSMHSKHEQNIQIRECFKLHCRVFENVMTEAKRFKFFQTKGYLEPVQFKIEDRYIETLKENGVVFDEESIYGFRVPLMHSLKYFLEIPGMFKTIIDYMNILQKSCDFVSNIIQAKFWLGKFINNIKDNERFTFIMYLLRRD